MNTSVLRQIISSALSPVRLSVGEARNDFTFTGRVTISVTGLTEPRKNINNETSVQHATENPVLEFMKMRKQASENLVSYGILKEISFENINQ
jgi:hypothetical protein